MDFRFFFISGTPIWRHLVVLTISNRKFDLNFKLLCYSHNVLEIGHHRCLDHKNNTYTHIQERETLLEWKTYFAQLVHDINGFRGIIIHVNAFVTIAWVVSIIPVFYCISEYKTIH